MKIRLARREDVGAIVEISNWAVKNTPANFAIEPEPVDSWTEMFDRTHEMFPWLVAVDDGDGVIGFAKASAHKGRCAYAWSADVSVYVRPEHHGRGVGTEMYGRLIPLLKAQGFVTLMAGITTPNPASQKLHESFGFVRVGTFEQMGWKFGRWHNVGYWQLFLWDESYEPRPLRSVREVWRETGNPQISQMAPID